MFSINKYTNDAKLIPFCRGKEFVDQANRLANANFTWDKENIIALSDLFKITLTLAQMEMSKNIHLTKLIEAFNNLPVMLPEDFAVKFRNISHDKLPGILSNEQIDQVLWAFKNASNDQLFNSYPETSPIYITFESLLSNLSANELANIASQNAVFYQNLANQDNFCKYGFVRQNLTEICKKLDCTEYIDPLQRLLSIISGPWGSFVDLENLILEICGSNNESFDKFFTLLESSFNLPKGIYSTIFSSNSPLVKCGICFCTAKSTGLPNAKYDDVGFFDLAFEMFRDRKSVV